ncbi:glycoside hydrolase family 30 protein [Roseateles amylovorans]|uniref:Glucosylceramidase n=1 Tax=Roseateles amylovorans TaxID=2978473 RepID=A0ABY6B7D3_9BURK|nr:glycoside hydrolase family 30 protein [Roseateles amylovorans]UXH80747.1 glucosylceramidase [Roseateles amylovorans]
MPSMTPSPASLPTSQPASPLRWTLSAKGADLATSTRFAEQPPLTLTDAAGVAAQPSLQGLPQLAVNSQRAFQRIEGFGGAFTEAAATTWQQLPPEEADALLRAYFDADAGHGYNFCRVHMNSCDFSLGNYAHAAVEGDTALAHFNIDRDRQALLPMILAAQKLAARPMQLLVSPWSPPAWMKTNGQMNNGGKLRPEYAAVWAQCYVRFIQAYEAEGVPVWGVSVQNEPDATQRWDSCVYSAEEERDFVRDHLGPALHAAGLSRIRIVIWDHNRDQMVQRADVVYSDPEAAKYVWGCGFHWYVEDHFDHVRLVHDAFPDKQLLFTEGCQEGGPHLGSWALGERYARSIINDLNRWTVGWIDWNLLLDETGGPNHVGNLCSAPMLADRATGRLMPQNSYDYLGHFARFIRPGARRVLCSASREALECTAAVNEDGSVALVVLNRSEEAHRFVLKIDGQATVATLPARAIASYLLSR